MASRTVPKTHKSLLKLCEIPRGKVVTYKELARVCGTSPRAVGSAMRSNKEPAKYPCYKVVSSSGGLTGYSAEGGLEKKRGLLLADGVRLVDEDRVSEECFFKFG